MCEKFFHSEHSFWTCFYSDLEKAKKAVHIVSPFITIKRSGKLSSYFRKLIKRGVSITIHTRCIDDHENHMRFQAKLSTIVLKSIGINFNFIPRMHQKIAIIDDQISWSGSLNILSWNNTPEQMTRFDCREKVREIIDTSSLSI